jgi:hypothetical protein
MKGKREPVDVWQWECDGVSVCACTSVSILSTSELQIQTNKLILNDPLLYLELAALKMQ